MINSIRTIVLVSWMIFTQGATLAQKDQADEEYAFIHTDRALYYSGESIYFSLFVLNKPFLQNKISVIGYVELYSYSNELLYRLKLKCDNGRAFGNIDLPGSLPTGIYYLKPFTLWMRNFPSEYSTPRPVLIVNSFDTPNIKPVVTLFSRVSIQSALERDSSAVTIQTSKNQYKPRERVDVTISGGRSKFTGPYSMAVRLFEDSSFLKTVHKSDSRNLPVKHSFDHRKERLVYPKLTESLQSGNFFEEYISSQPRIDSLKSRVQNRHSFIDIINDSYEIAQSYEYSSLKIPSDISYSPNDYQRFETVKEFLAEVVPQVRVNKRKGVYHLRIRNSENSQRVYFYDENPLILIDGYIVENIQTVLNLDPFQVKTLDISWKLATLNLSAVSPLANHGIISIYTKDKIGERLGNIKLYDGFHEPKLLKEVNYRIKESSDEVIPDFRNPISWNPLINLDGSSKLSFYTSDEPGKFIIEVIGISEEGKVVIAHKVIHVSL